MSEAKVIPQTRRAVLLDALPNVPKPLSQLIDDYARRLPPSTLIEQLSRAISPDVLSAAMAIDGGAWDKRSLRLSIPGEDGLSVVVTAFYSGPQLKQALSLLLTSGTADGLYVVDCVPVLCDRLERIKAGQNVVAAITRFLAEEPGALCAVDLWALGWVEWGTLVLAVPEGRNGPGGSIAWPLIPPDTSATGRVTTKPLSTLYSAAEPVCQFVGCSFTKSGCGWTWTECCTAAALLLSCASTSAAQ